MKNEDQPTPIVDPVVQPVEEQPVTIVGGPVEHNLVPIVDPAEPPVA